MDGDDRPGQLEATVGHLERLCGRLEQAEQQFRRLTDECDQVLHGLVTVDRRHSAAIASLNERLGDWCNLEGKLLEESSRRLERFERGVSHEWMVLRRLNEEPIADLREQAEALRRTCLEAARVARLRLESAEQAHATHAEDIDRRLAEWTRQLLQAQRPGAEGTALAAPRPGEGAEPWSFEGVAQLHQEMRSAPPARDAHDTDPQRDADSPRRDADSPRRDANDQAVAEESPPRERLGSRWAVAAGGLALAAILVVLVWMSGGPGTRGAAASVERPGPAVPVAAPAAPVPAVLEPDPRLVEAQRAAERAAILVEILAAPDLRRYAMGGLGATPNAYAQVLWSRTRGLAITASRLPPPPAASTYQVWIRNASTTASAGTLAPDANGRASLVVSGPLKLPAPGAIRVTIEPQAGSPQPTGTPCLAGGPIP